jgi:hypothetical protein
MRQIPISSSLLSFLDDLEYTEAALAADDDTHELAKPFRDEIKEWDGIFKAERESRRAVTRAEAVVAVRNAQLDAHTSQFGARVLAEGGNDRKGPFFRRFFPVAPSEFVRRPLRKQAEHTIHVMVVELGKLDKKHALRPFAASLEKLAKAALSALDARTQSKGDRGIAGHDVDEWKEGVNALRLSTYAELLKIAADVGRSRAWADAFFRSDSAVSAAATDDGPAEAAAPTPKPAAVPA